MNWQLKLSNWISGGALEKYQRQSEISENKCQQVELDLERIKTAYEEFHKQLRQIQAQLQISEGIYLEQKQNYIQLKHTEIALGKCEEKCQEQQLILQRAKIALNETEANLADSRDWIKQIRSRIEVVEVQRLLEKDIDALWGFGIGSPDPQTEIVGGSLTIRGWVLGKQAKASHIRVSWQHNILIETVIELPREFVQKNYPEVPKAFHSGFETTFTVANIPPTVELEIQAVLEDKTVITIGLIVLKRL